MSEHSAEHDTHYTLSFHSDPVTTQPTWKALSMTDVKELAEHTWLVQLHGLDLSPNTLTPEPRFLIFYACDYIKKFLLGELNHLSTRADFLLFTLKEMLYYIQDQ